MQRMWNSYLAVASMIPNVTMLILNAVFGHRQVILMKTFIIGVLNHNKNFAFLTAKLSKLLYLLGTKRNRVYWSVWF